MSNTAFLPENTYTNFKKNRISYLEDKSKTYYTELGLEKLSFVSKIKDVEKMTRFDNGRAGPTAPYLYIIKEFIQKIGTTNFAELSKALGKSLDQDNPKDGIDDIFKSKYGLFKSANGGLVGLDPLSVPGVSGDTFKPSSVGISVSTLSSNTSPVNLYSVYSSLFEEAISYNAGTNMFVKASTDLHIVNGLSKLNCVSYDKIYSFAEDYFNPQMIIKIKLDLEESIKDEKDPTEFENSEKGRRTKTMVKGGRHVRKFKSGKKSSKLSSRKKSGKKNSTKKISVKKAQSTKGVKKLSKKHSGKKRSGKK
jgi:hypothetical protein